MIEILDVEASGLREDELNYGLTKNGAHACLLWRDEENIVHAVHQYLTEIVRTEKNVPLERPSIYFGKAQISKIKSNFIINMVEALCPANGRIASSSGINPLGHDFSIQGLMRGDVCGSGMTCASFIVQLLRGAKISLFADDYEIVEADIVWQNEKIDEAEKIRYGNPAKMRNEVGTVPRFTPLAVCAGLSIDESNYPLKRVDVSKVEVELEIIMNRNPL